MAQQAVRTLLMVKLHLQAVRNGEQWIRSGQDPYASLMERVSKPDKVNQY